MLAHFAIGLPLFAVLALGAMAFILAGGVYTLDTLGSTLFGAVDSWALLSLPLFILVGELMTRGRMAEDLVNLGESLVGWIPGGLGMTTIFSCFLISGTSGSATADTATIGKIMTPALKRRGYDPSYAASLAASGGVLGPIVPPSIIFIVYGIATSTSVGDLFIGGVVPGVMFAAALCLTHYLICVGTTWAPADRAPFSLRKAVEATWRAKYGIGAPVLIIGGIYGGLFTPTEAAAVAVAYVLFVEVVLQRSIRVRDLSNILAVSSKISGALIPVIAFSVLFGEALAVLHVPEAMVQWFSSFNAGFAGSVALILALLVIVGCILEPIAAVLVIMPVLLPVSKQLGFDDVHFGVFVVCVLSAGLIHPPIGMNLFAAAAVTGEPFMRVGWRAVPAFVALIAMCAVVAAVPATVIWFR
ncbi:TRAP transporter large permease [Variovorax sp. RA8]|uniref:TRAP transporter large permease n=1 Tax=Variovorax sp. (strain JCM 16519 / RA8) TaxID=662548 RepID=UPI0013A5837B|nr:TRAP transporter large permease [Variovorax sp. RA8]